MLCLCSVLPARRTSPVQKICMQKNCEDQAETASYLDRLTVLFNIKYRSQLTCLAYSLFCDCCSHGRTSLAFPKTASDERSIVRYRGASQIMYAVDPILHCHATHRSFPSVTCATDEWYHVENTGIHKVTFVICTFVQAFNMAGELLLDFLRPGYYSLPHAGVDRLR